MKKDLNYIAALEKAMKEQYGEQSIQNPIAGWDVEKEKHYLEDSKKLLKKESETESDKEKVDLGGVLISKKLINKNNSRHCNICDIYSFNRNDDTYFSKFDCCYKCYIKYVDGREDRWNSGWRPNGA